VTHAGREKQRRTPGPNQVKQTLLEAQEAGAKKRHKGQEQRRITGVERRQRPERIHSEEQAPGGGKTAKSDPRTVRRPKRDRSGTESQNASGFLEIRLSAGSGRCEPRTPEGDGEDSKGEMRRVYGTEKGLSVGGGERFSEGNNGGGYVLSDRSDRKQDRGLHLQKQSNLRNRFAIFM